MTSKERMITALCGGVPDRVPCAPDISNMIPCRLTGKPFPDIYVRNNPPLWRAYIDAVDALDIDGWFTYGYVDFKADYRYTLNTRVEKDGDRETVVMTYSTPKGELVRRETCYPADPPTPTEKIIKDFKKDFEKLKFLFPKVTGYDCTAYNEQYKAFGDRGLFCVFLPVPGFHIYNDYFNGNLEALTYAYYDYPELFEEFNELFKADVLGKLEFLIEVRPESILTGGSGSITMQSPQLFDELSLPVIKTIAYECKRAGIITGIHSCGKEMHLVKRCAEETELDYLNPLEIPPQGDSDLKTVKDLYGDKLSLMGNLHTTAVMLNGSPELVELMSLRAIADAGKGGGFVLSTGDQCGRDTPLENIRTMVRVCREYGDYESIDFDRISDRIKELEAVAGLGGARVSRIPQGSAT